MNLYTAYIYGAIQPALLDKFVHEKWDRDRYGKPVHQW